MSFPKSNNALDWVDAFRNQTRFSDPDSVLIQWFAAALCQGYEQCKKDNLSKNNDIVPALLLEGNCNHPVNSREEQEIWGKTTYTNKLVKLAKYVAEDIHGVIKEQELMQKLKEIDNVKTIEQLVKVISEKWNGTSFDKIDEVIEPAHEVCICDIRAGGCTCGVFRENRNGNMKKKRTSCLGGIKNGCKKKGGWNRTYVLYMRTRTKIREAMAKGNGI